jgi:hypothetical protein
MHATTIAPLSCPIVFPLINKEYIEFKKLCIVPERRYYRNCLSSTKIKSRCWCCVTASRSISGIWDEVWNRFLFLD